MNKTKFNALCFKVSDKKGITFDEAVTYYFLEHVIRKISESEYKKDMVFRGGYIISKLCNIEQRTSVDLDMVVANPDKDPILQIGSTLKFIFGNIGKDEIQYTIHEIEENNDPFLHTQYRATIRCQLDNIVQRVPLDISIGEPSAKEAVDFKFKSYFGEGNIEVKAYPLEAMLAEKLQSMYMRGSVNIRCKDYYDFHVLYNNKKNIDVDLYKKCLKESFEAKNMEFDYKTIKATIEELKSDGVSLVRWRAYLKKNAFTKYIEFEEVLNEIDESLLKATDQFVKKSRHGFRR